VLRAGRDHLTLADLAISWFQFPVGTDRSLVRSRCTYATLSGQKRWKNRFNRPRASFHALRGLDGIILREFESDFG